MKDMKTLSIEDIRKMAMLHSELQELVDPDKIQALNKLLDELDYIYRG